MPRSKPVNISIPAIGVDHAVRPTGLNSDGTMHTPPLSEVQWPDWYKYSPTPGQQGPSVIVGHINSAKYGPGVFSKLDDVSQGDTVNVKRKDGSVAHFTVFKTEEYPKSDFPTKKVYGNTKRAELRLITCGGSFNASKHSYRDNIVAYAKLTNDTT
jgi:LPXTG-site transpeptidase (sortase) family protein